MVALYAVAAVVIGMAFALQPSINAAAAKGLGGPMAGTALSVAITFAAAAALMPAFGGSLRPTALWSLPWWVVFGGLIGALVVAGGIVIAPVTGLALFFACFVLGQLLGSIAADHFGAFGVDRQPISALRVGGAVLVVVGAVLVRRG